MLRLRSLRNSLLFMLGGVSCLLFLNLLIGYSVNSPSYISRAERKQVDAEKECKPDLDSQIREERCSADWSKEMKCLRDAQDEIFFPFSFIKKRFDVIGKVSKDGKRFEMFTSYSKVRLPEGNYDPKGAFGHFATYSVETRERVRCINAQTGVPMSTQWSTQWDVPYYYPIQIAQFGLQHYSRMVTANFSKYEEVRMGTKTKEWKGSAAIADTNERLFWKDERLGDLVNISSTGSLANPGCYVFMDGSPALHIVNFSWLPRANASFTILAKIVASDTLILLNYVHEEDMRCVWNDSVSNGKNNQLSYSYSLGAPKAEWKDVSRDVLIDAARAISSGEGKKKEDNVVLHPGDIRIVSVGFRGNCTVKRSIVQSSERHKQAFLTAVDWLMNNQDKNGGWQVPVERAIADRKLVLPAGWYSAMGQGHGISLLTRAYWTTKNESYLEACAKALELFEKNATEGGVRNNLWGVAWYEEYPTNPGSFVLNGFIYSLLGLYDLSSVSDEEISSPSVHKAISRAAKLWSEGLSSLQSLLPLYDTGSGSIYDLRHIALKTAPNLARWDYHAVHIYLLKWLVQITENDYLNETAERWIDYAHGKRAKHN